jgi:hypothetical protein
VSLGELARQARSRREAGSDAARQHEIQPAACRRRAGGAPTAFRVIDCWPGSAEPVPPAAVGTVAGGEAGSVGHPTGSLGEVGSDGEILSLSLATR